MGTTKIEWATRVWNPVTGCTPVSEGCANCWAKRMAKRLAGRYGYPKDEPFRVTLHPDKLDEPLRWRKASIVFVCSMGDLFHEDVPDEFVARVWGTMRYAAEHTFLVLTKREGRMKQWLRRCGMRWVTHDGTPPANAYEGTGVIVGEARNWPLSNVWLGTSVENQAAADERIPHLLNTPAAKRFVSCEPLLGPITFRWAKWHPVRGSNHLDGLRQLDWVIAGGESGPGAHPMHPDWARSLRDQCLEAHVPFFFKQWGEYVAPAQMPASTYREIEDFGCGIGSENAPVSVGKKAAGRLLDGREWDEMPERGG